MKGAARSLTKTFPYRRAGKKCRYDQSGEGATGMGGQKNGKVFISQTSP
jgi:hypothetical protein